MSEVKKNESKRQVFSRRAKALALETRDTASERPGIGIVEFRLAHEKYAVESIYVREVLPLKEQTPLPDTPSFVQGIINVRGQILSIIDLRVLLDLPRPAPTRATRVIVLKSGDMELGIVADAVVQSRFVLLDELHPALSTMTGFRETCLRGIVDGDLAVLDVARLLANPAIIVNEQIEE
jgi:purine-binding chemotaxis protein CheW